MITPLRMPSALHQRLAPGARGHAVAVPHLAGLHAAAPNAPTPPERSVAVALRRLIAAA